MKVVAMSDHFELYYCSQYLGRFDKTLDGITEMIQFAFDRGAQLNEGWWV